MFLFSTIILTYQLYCKKKKTLAEEQLPRILSTRRKKRVPTLCAYLDEFPGLISYFIFSIFTLFFWKKLILDNSCSLLF
ncbi:hypothetical protein B9Z55_002197 [Caenorhabditis nigoni]|uniref:Uncharacterized protein n=1 Tax=Caenorhabditis nigoni TaxID=1611254 RepID=A0A2G5VJK0_9PELO|nr:hypothetical protein B9Z55_002197 [Caenorhabditis nigoni]